MGGWAAAAQAAAQVADTGLQVWSAMRANKTQESIARKNIEFQREAAQNRYQWTMADMRKAGLNPILAYQQGGGSGSVTGSTANIQPVYQKDGISSAVGKAMEMKILEQQLKNMKVDEVQKYEDIHKTSTEASAIKTQEIINRESIKPRLDAEATSAKMKAIGDTITGQMMEKYPQLRELNMLIQSITGTLDAGGSAKSLVPKRGAKPITSTYKDTRRLGRGRTVTETIHNR